MAFVSTILKINETVLKNIITMTHLPHITDFKLSVSIISGLYTSGLGIVDFGM